MSRKGKMTAVKLQRERQLADRRRRKQERRTETRPNAPRREGDEDPDLAGIQPGPQPLQAWQLEVLEEGEEAEE